MGDEKNRKKLELYQIEGHAKPVTRRDFLGLSFASCGAYFVMPSILSMILMEDAARAEGLACGTPGVKNGALPFIVIDCVGGASTSANWVALDAGGQVMPAGAYGRMGLGAGVPEVDTAFGAPMATTASQVLAGMRAVMTPEAQAATRMGTFAHNSQSDTGANPSSAIGYVAAFGLQGSLIAGPLGMGSNARSGGNSGTPYLDAALRPLRVSNLNSVTSTVNYQPVLQRLPGNALKALAKAATRLSGSQAAKLNSMTLGDQMSTLAQCGYVSNQAIAEAGANTAVDPRTNDIMRQVYGIAANTATNNRNVVLASLVWNTLQGYSGPSCIQIGGCDYHNGSQATGDAKDLEIGQTLGRALQAAFALGKPLVFQIISDGNCISDRDTRVWRSDTNTQCQSILGIIDPKGARTMARTQVGAFKPTGQGSNVDTTTPIGASPERATQAAFLNYLNLVGGGAMDSFGKFASPGALGGDMSKMLLFS